MNNIEGFTNRTVINQEAAKWVLLLEDTPKLSQQQIAELNTWVTTSQVHRECIEAMARSWGEMDLLSEVMLPTEIHEVSLYSVMLTRLFYPVVMLLALFDSIMKQRKKLLHSVIAMPAILGALTWMFVWVIQPHEEKESLLLTTQIGKSLSHVMPDGSILWLNSSTQVEVNYSQHFRRIYLLQGEAHFEVSKDTTRPFEVYVDDRLVRAIGTAFSVYKVNGRIEVLVTQGTVELAVIENTLVVIPDDFQQVEIKSDFIHKSTETALPTRKFRMNEQPANIKKMLGQLTAGQRISIPIQNEEMSEVVELEADDVSRFLSWKEGTLVFAGESLEEVIQEITRHTQVQIDVLDPQLKSMRIGGQFQIGETDALFYVLESGFGISVDKLSENHVQLRVKEK